MSLTMLHSIEIEDLIRQKCSVFVNNYSHARFVNNNNNKHL